MSLATTMLVFEWRRFLPALLSVVFAGVLMLVQLGLLKGMFGTVTVLVDASDAELWVTAPSTFSVDQSADIPEALSAMVRVNPDVVRSETLVVRDATWRSAGGTRVAVTLVGLDPDAAALACPRPLRDGPCARLAIPGSVVVDESEAGKLGTEAGQLADIDGHRVHVAMLSRGMRSIGSTYVFTSLQSLRALADPDGGSGGLTSFVLAKVGGTIPLVKTRRSLQHLLRSTTARVWTRNQLSRQSQSWWLHESGVGAGFLFSTLLGIVIAVVITSQSLRGVILGQLREYAVLRAMGISAWRLSTVIIEQSAWIGAAGAILMALVAAGVAGLARGLDVPFTLTPGGIVVAMATGLSTAIGSGVLALRELYRLQPAELLR